MSVAAGGAMSFETAQRLTEVMLALAMIQQSAEHIAARRADAWIFVPRIALCLLLLSGAAPLAACLGLWAVMVVMLHRFGGAYNGGSDKMTVLILTCLTASHLAVGQVWREMALAYLAVQLTLSYFVSGYIKIINPEWRSGRALVDVFAFSAYPVAENLRRWGDRPRVLFAMSWAVMLFEVIFPLSLLHPWALAGGLAAAAAFHFSNACFFGLNRFFWIWISAYPSILWFQGRIFG